MTRNQFSFFWVFLFMGIFLSHNNVDAQMETVVPLVESEIIDASDNSTGGMEKEKLIDEMVEAFEAKYKDEEVVNLSYTWSIEVNKDWSYVEKVYNKKKILKKEGKRYGEIPITYEKGVDEVVNISAYTTTPDGEKHRYTKIHDMPVYAGYKSYSDYRRKIVSMPQINVGSIVEYEKEVRSKEKPIKDAYWQTFYLSFGIPTFVADISISFPKDLKVVRREFNLDCPTKVTVTDDRIIYSWHFMDVHYDEVAEEFVPYLKPEEMKNVVEFSSIEKWSEISDWYNDVVVQNSVVTPEIKKAAELIFKGQESVKDKARALVRYVSNNFRYISMVYGNNKMEPHRTDEVFTNKYADCKDIAVLSKVLLDIVGVKSEIVLFNDEEDTSDPQYDLPDPGLFDHVLLLVQDTEGDFYLDPFLEGYDIGEYPMFVQNGYCFVINDSGGYFDRFPVFDEMRNYEYMKSLIEMSADGAALYTVESIWDLDFSIESRQVYVDMSDEEMDRFLDYLNGLHGEVLERKWENAEPEDYGRIRSYLKYKKEDVFQDTGGVIVINIGAFGNKEMYFKEETRSAPIFFPSNLLQEDIKTYRIPKGYTIKHIPEDIDLDIGLFRVSRKYKVKGRNITIEEKLWNKRMEIPASEYGKIKDFFDTLEKKTRQRIVLKKRPKWVQNTIDVFCIFFKSMRL